MNRISRIFQLSKWNRIYSVRKFSSSLEESIFQLTRKSITHSEEDGYVVKSPYKPMETCETTIDRNVWTNLLKWQNHVAIECASTGRKFTYSQLRDHSAALAIRLRKNLGLKKGDIVAVCLPNIPEYPITFLGSIEASLKVTTVSPAYSANEIAYQLSNTQSKLVFCEVSNFANVKKACELAQLNEIKIVALKSRKDQSIPTGAIHFDELVNVANLNLSEASYFNDDVDTDEVVVLPYSSGTTGLPKGVMHSHKTFLVNSDESGARLFSENVSSPTTNEFQEVFPCFLPLYHIYGLSWILQCKLSLGCKIITIEKYDANQFLELLLKHKATFLSLVPPIVIQLGHHPAAKPIHFESVRHILCAADSLSKEDTGRLLKKAPHTKFLQGYGMTEGLITFTSPMLPQNYGTVGCPQAGNEMKIVPIESSIMKGLPANQKGEIFFRGPRVMKGYFNNNKATKEAFTEDGWLRTGDIGFYDENGLFYVTQRLKELIKVNGLQVAPLELEIILRNHPEVVDAAVVGVPHPKCGEVPKAFVVRKPGSTTIESEIQDYVAKQVSKHKQLTGGVIFIENIPKSPAGKILRRELK